MSGCHKLGLPLSGGTPSELLFVALLSCLCFHFHGSLVALPSESRLCCQQAGEISRSERTLKSDFNLIVSLAGWCSF